VDMPPNEMASFCQPTEKESTIRPACQNRGAGSTGAQPAKHTKESSAENVKEPPLKAQSIQPSAQHEQGTESSGTMGTDNCQQHLKNISQFAYALGALPICTVITIGPLYLHEELGAPIWVIGCFLMIGELLGILAVYISQHAPCSLQMRKTCWLNASLLSSGVCLGLVTLSTEDTPYLAGACLVLVQIFNAAYKRGIEEDICLSFALKRHKPRMPLADANTMRHVTLACASASSTLVYVVHSKLAFFFLLPSY